MKLRTIILSGFILLLAEPALGQVPDERGISRIEICGDGLHDVRPEGLRELSRKAEGLAVPACAVKGLKRPRATWLRPEIRVQVRHLRNGSGLRHASVKAILG